MTDIKIITKFKIILIILTILSLIFLLPSAASGSVGATGNETEMTTLQAVILGIVQGATEFLPVSSSGHLVVVPYLLGFPNAPVIFDAMVHVATLFAVLIFFKKEFIDIILSFRSIIAGEKASEEVKFNRRLGIMLVIGTIPAAAAGFFLEDFFTKFFSEPVYAGFFLLVTGTFLILIERISEKLNDVHSLNINKSLIIGCAQAVAIFPGISRSGSTIAAGMLLGLTRESATRFSFLLSAPIIAGAGAFSIKKAFFDGTWAEMNIATILIGSFFAFIVAYVSIKFLIDYVKKHPLNVFAYYCYVVGAVVILKYITGF
jgi:undecaprenyl-diphosphatase